MAAESIIGSWFRYFPEHYLWSQLMSGQINITPKGGSNFHELDQIGRRLSGRAGDAEAWHDAWAWMADKTLAHAEDEERRGHELTSMAAYVRSAIYRYASERFVHPEDPRKSDSYKKLLPHYEKGMKYRVPGFERVEVPYEEGPLAAYLLPPKNPTGSDPYVAFFDGLDGSKEITVLWGALALIERGVGVLCVDGPGQGETLRLRKIPSRPDYEVAGTAAFDFLDARPRGGFWAHRPHGHEHGRLLRAAHRRFRASLRGVSHLGCAFRLSRGLGAQEKSAGEWRHHLLFGHLAVALGSGNAGHGLGDGKMQGL